MRKLHTKVAAAVLVLFGVSACADLEVTNPNDPDRETVLQAAGDVESLISGGFNTWYTGTAHWTNTFWASNAAFQQGASAANAGNIDHSVIPRQPIINNTAYEDFGNVVERTWQRSYRALAAVSDGLRTLQDRPELADDFSTADLARLNAFAKYIQGLGHATLALWYDKAYILDEDTDLSTELTAVPYSDVMTAAMGYFDDALAAASGMSDIPTSWHMEQIDEATFRQIVHSWKAVFRASAPRMPSETVDWNAVITDLNSALTADYYVTADPFNGWYNGAHDITGGPNGWANSHYFILGMADQSGNYQDWLAQPVGDRYPWFGTGQDDDPFLIITDDTRFPQGATLTDQINNPGDYYLIPTTDGPYDYGYVEHMDNPGRGTWRWSYYYNPTSFDYWNYIDFEIPLFLFDELNLLRAEALLETSQPGPAATIINQTRTAHGLNATDASGTNTSCVPKLPDNSCGNLMEMLKWEKRVETQGYGALMRLSWFWDARRWGDHYLGTPMQWPIPASDLQVLQLDVYTFGGPNDSPPGASDGSSYNWPGEN